MNDFEIELWVEGRDNFKGTTYHSWWTSFTDAKIKQLKAEADIKTEPTQFIYEVALQQGSSYTKRKLFLNKVKAIAYKEGLELQKLEGNVFMSEIEIS